MNPSRKRIRVILAKLGLDGHDRGVRVVARALRDAGMEVIYTGLWQTPERVARTVADEDADALGVSLLSGAHMTLVPRLLECMADQRVSNVPLLVGGTIPGSDIARLGELGVAKVFTPGTNLDEVVRFIRDRVGSAPGVGAV